MAPKSKPCAKSATSGVKKGSLVKQAKKNSIDVHAAELAHNQAVQDILDTTFRHKTSYEKNRLIINQKNLRAAVSALKWEAKARGGRVSTLAYQALDNEYRISNVPGPVVQETDSASMPEPSLAVENIDNEVDAEFRRVLALSIIPSRLKRQREPLISHLNERSANKQNGQAVLSTTEVRKLLASLNKYESTDGQSGPQHILQVFEWMLKEGFLESHGDLFGPCLKRVDESLITLLAQFRGKAKSFYEDHKSSILALLPEQTCENIWQYLERVNQIKHDLLLAASKANIAKSLWCPQYNQLMIEEFQANVMKARETVINQDVVTDEHVRKCSDKMKIFAGNVADALADNEINFQATIWYRGLHILRKVRDPTVFIDDVKSMLIQEVAFQCGKIEGVSLEAELMPAPLFSTMTCQLSATILAPYQKCRSAANAIIVRENAESAQQVFKTLQKHSADLNRHHRSHSLNLEFLAEMQKQFGSKVLQSKFFADVIPKHSEQVALKTGVERVQKFKESALYKFVDPGIRGLLDPSFDLLQDCLVGDITKLSFKSYEGFDRRVADSLVRFAFIKVRRPGTMLYEILTGQPCIDHLVATIKDSSADCEEELLLIAPFKYLLDDESLRVVEASASDTFAGAVKKAVSAKKAQQAQSNKKQKIDAEATKSEAKSNELDAALAEVDNMF